MTTITVAAPAPTTHATSTAVTDMAVDRTVSLGFRRPAPPDDRSAKKMKRAQVKEVSNPVVAAAVDGVFEQLRQRALAHLDPLLQEGAEQPPAPVSAAAREVVGELQSQPPHIDASKRWKRLVKYTDALAKEALSTVDLKERHMRAATAYCYAFRMGPNMREIHERTVRDLSDCPLWKIEEGQATEQDRQNLLVRITEIWVAARRKFGSAEHDVYGVNIPCQQFTLVMPEGKDDLLFGRSESPATSIRVRDHYVAFLQEQEEREKTHLDVCLERLRGVRKTRSRTRFDEQHWWSHALLTMGFDVYHSDDWHPSSGTAQSKTAVDLRESLLKSYFSAAYERKLLPTHVREDDSLIGEVRGLLEHLHSDLFPTAKTYTGKEWTVYVLLSGVVIQEWLAERYSVTTTALTCVEHIDRGPMMTTAAFVYAMVKSGQLDDADLLAYIQPLLLAPALLTRIRTMHYSTCLSTVMVLETLFDKHVSQRLQERKTYYSRARVEIPQSRAAL